MLGALGALIRKDERTLFNKHTDGLYVSAPKLSQEMEEEFTEDLGYDIQCKLLEKWPFNIDIDVNDAAYDKTWDDMKVLFQQSRLRILYTSEESHEWVLYTASDLNLKEQQEEEEEEKKQQQVNNVDISEHDLNCLGGVYQKFNFEFGDGKFHDIVSMGSTKNIGWNVLESSSFDPFVLCTVGNILNLQSKINAKYGVSVPMELWHIILGFSVDCFQPITQMLEVDIVLRDVRRWTQNLYLSENLRRRDDFGDERIRKWGRIFIEIGGMIDAEYIKYRKQFSLRKKLVRFLSKKLDETSQKLKNLKNNSAKDKGEENKKKKKDKKAKKKRKKKKRKKKHRQKNKRATFSNSQTLSNSLMPLSTHKSLQ